MIDYVVRVDLDTSTLEQVVRLVERLTAENTAMKERIARLESAVLSINLRGKTRER